jgi:hypothetical protein
MYMNTERNGGSERVGAVAAGDADAILSSHGKANAAPAPRKTVLREIRLDMIGSFSNTQSKALKKLPAEACATTI